MPSLTKFLDEFKLYSDLLNSWVIPFIFLFIVVYAYARRVKVYEVFVEGAKEGFNVAIMIIPYLVVILSAIAIFRASGAMQFVATSLGAIIPPTVFPPDAILLSLIKPLSGGAARGVMLDVFQRQGVDSFASFVCSVIQGSTETTFYVIAVYFGSVGIKNSRHTIAVGLAAELIAIIASVIIANIWWGNLPK
ncbi:MAG: spore maturation protein [Candidatus Sumerlaeaceae bacterium]|nr:spore maturation protein [Candidatus Sumerlaeaceae bacterium]